MAIKPRLNSGLPNHILGSWVPLPTSRLWSASLSPLAWDALPHKMHALSFLDLLFSCMLITAELWTFMSLFCFTFLYLKELVLWGDFGGWLYYTSISAVLICSKTSNCSASPSNFLIRLILSSVLVVPNYHDLSSQLRAPGYCSKLRFIAQWILEVVNLSLHRQS